MSLVQAGKLIRFSHLNVPFFQKYAPFLYEVASHDKNCHVGDSALLHNN